MSELLITRDRRNGGWWLVNDEGERDWFQSLAAAQRAAGGHARVLICDD